ncbi:MAG: hypothetical protein DDT40_01304 [candidate division WS2 bacterium]|uniref:HTH cro/C1-type domain-containing protein n=1 Tax=Psychracetigena formicireducens TaxID=2986056 RepID=A0A9E2BHF3_PSYF1|nr:hypothetical protein [Candidatus Psychracetigena formicireducens]MBT9145636.1 hypothetical protein [Candidatus Psychracetigena formicireducens]MBT9151120.1 hypothetical protein [Candidatus Psychracetigena formicireducens]
MMSTIYLHNIILINAISKVISQVGGNLKNLKKLKGLSQDRFSKLADISYNTVIKMESSGINHPSIDRLQNYPKPLV